MRALPRGSQLCTGIQGSHHQVATVSYTHLDVYKRQASNCCRKYLVLGRDDEASIAMIAFNEAIDSFDSTGGASFLSFAEIVVKRRMVDYFRRQSKKSEEIPISAFESDENEDGILQKIESKEAHTVLQIQEETEQRRDVYKRQGHCPGRYPPGN